MVTSDPELKQGDPNELVDLLATMYAHGFGEYVEDAMAVLPPDWRIRYPHSPRTLAMGLTYYVAMDEFEQTEVANQYGVTATSVYQPYRSLVEDNHTDD